MKRPRRSGPVAESVGRARTGLVDALASISYIRGMNLELSDVQAEVLTRELHASYRTIATPSVHALWY
jgi:hypothetical protein